MASFQIKSYSVTLTNCASPYAYVMLFDAATAGASTFRARLNFSQLSESNAYSFTQTGNFIEVPTNWKSLPSVIDLLRNEKPASFYWFSSTKVASVSCGEEPVGEGEAG